MHNSYRALAGSLVLAMSLTACGGGGGGSLPGLLGSSNSGANAGSAGQAGTAAPMISIPKTSGALAYSDLGRRSPSAPVSVAITLNYNNQAQLDAFVASASGPGGTHAFLTPAQFNSEFAPTAQQEQAVVTALQQAGFTVTQRYANRTVVDATAPSSVVEKFFKTEMHSVSQGQYGTRFTNLTPATVPASIASLVRTASLSNVVIARTKVAQEGGPIRTHIDAPGDKPHHVGNAKQAPASMRIMASGCSGQLLLNPGFESGEVDWTDTNGDITDDSADAYQGSYFAWIDGYTGSVTDPGVSQTVSIPAGCTATLTYYLYVYTADGSTAKDHFYVKANGTTVQTFSNANSTGGKYVQESVNLSSYAGQSVTVGFSGAQTGSRVTDFFVDNTALTLSGGSSTPTPSPTASPTASPTHSPTPTPSPTASPTSSPTSSPTHSPTPTPSATPTASPTASPTTSPAAGCTGAAALNGPLTNSSGTLATGVAKPFDYPVQHGCNGVGYTAAIVIDDAVNTSYVASYLSAAGVTQTGTITNEAVDGGGTGDDAETDLDVQTISGLAPGANIIVYDEGSLSDQNIEDAYNKVLSDGKAVVVNSSFGGCESSDTSFESATNTIAEQGAAEGVTFVASAGDTGSDECGSNDNSKGVSAPAGDPYFTSIGGVNFTESSAGVLETVTAGDSSCGDSSGVCYGGGGVSTVVALPSWQSGIAGMITTGRNQPDISLPFDPVAVYTGGAFAEYLGTSWSSPAAAALFLETDELHGSKIGSPNATLYSLFSSTGYADYYTPCTSGNNIAYTCSATQYNQAAGIGAPKGWALANAL